MIRSQPAVRITHLPTGIVVISSNERSLLQNKRKALSVLRSKLRALDEGIDTAGDGEVRYYDADYIPFELETMVGGPDVPPVTPLEEAVAQLSDLRALLEEEL